MSKCASWVLFLGLLATPAGSFAGEDPPQGKFTDDWYTVAMQGARCGHMHSTVERIGNEIHTRSATQITIARGKTIVRIKMDNSYRETLAGEPIAFKHTTVLAKQPVTIYGERQGGMLKLVTEQNGVEKVEHVEFDPEVKFPWGQILEQRKHGLRAGTSFKVKTYEPSLKSDGPIELEFEFFERETIDVLGKKRELTRATMTMLGVAPFETKIWVDEDATPVVMEMAFGAFSFKMVQSSKADALRDGEAPEMFIETFVRSNRRIGPEARKAVLRLTLPADGKDKLPAIPNTGMQSVKRVNDREVILTVQRLDWAAIRKKTKDGDASEEDMSEFLRASTTLDIDNRKIKRRARRAVRGAETTAQKADSLRRFVTDYVTVKGLDIGFATASEVVTTRQGDCTEHSVLLAALARASGLPARGVSGIVQIPPGPMSPAKGAAFGYHMWTQVYIGGQWVDIDAAMRQTDCDPTHIALSLLPLNDEGMLDSVMSLLPLLGKLEIEVVRVE